MKSRAWSDGLHSLKVSVPTVREADSEVVKWVYAARAGESQEY